MDEATVRQNLEELQERMRVISEEATVLETLIKGYEGWLRLYASSQSRGQLSPLADGQPSFREAIRQVLRGAQGEPLHAKEIWRRLQQMGATTKAKDPVAAVDFTSYTIKEIKKSGPREWRWVGLNNGNKAGDTVPLEMGTVSP